MMMKTVNVLEDLLNTKENAILDVLLNGTMMMVFVLNATLLVRPAKIPILVLLVTLDILSALLPKNV